MAVIALALTLGYSQCVATCALEPASSKSAGHCPQHQDLPRHQNSNDAPQSQDTCAHHSAIEIPDAPALVLASVLPVALAGAHAPQLRTASAAPLLEASAGPPGLKSRIAPLRI